jgi:peptide deformylase
MEQIKYNMIRIFRIILVFALFVIFTQCEKDSLAVLPQQATVVDTLSLTQAEKDSIMKGSDTTIMRILTIFNHKDSLQLRTKSTSVRPDTNDVELMRLIHRMYVTVRAPINNGVGIAAVQVGINRRIIWVQRLDKTGKPFECYLNPKITLYSGTIIHFAGDACLSIPGQSGTSHRYTAVVVDYDRPDGTHNTEIVMGYGGSNYTAVIFQHEIDHLYGILYIDRL